MQATMNSLLAKVTKSDVIHEPFPHIVVKDALDNDMFENLTATLPTLEKMGIGASNINKKASSSNVRFNYLAKEILNDVEMSDVWHNFIGLHTSQTFLQHFFEVFQDYILDLYPDFERKYGAFSTLKAGLRKADAFANADVLIDTMISANTPVTTTPSSIRRGHIDLPDKLFAGLFYMRHPQDTSTGGDLEIYRFKKGKPYGFNNCEIKDKYIEHVKTIKYERNVLVLFLNSISSLHGVTVRSLTTYPRYFVNIVGEVKQPLFNYWKYQEVTPSRYLNRLKKLIGNFKVA